MVTRIVDLFPKIVALTSKIELETSEKVAAIYEEQKVVIGETINYKTGDSKLLTNEGKKGEKINIYLNSIGLYKASLQFSTRTFPLYPNCRVRINRSILDKSSFMFAPD